MKISIHDYAEAITGRQYGDELTKAEEKELKNLGYVAIFGYSDDNTKILLRGAIYDFIDADNGTEFKLRSTHILPNNCGCNCEYCGFNSVKAEEIQVILDEDESFTWVFRTSVTHATFNIFDQAEPYCRGIIIDTRDLPGYVS
jgi:hypothetical protein